MSINTTAYCWLFMVVLGGLLGGCTTSTKIICPQLSPPPASIVDSLEDIGAQDPNAAAWVIGLERQYQKQEKCGP